MYFAITNGRSFQKKAYTLYTNNVFVGAENPFRQTIVSIREIAISKGKFLNYNNNINKHFTHPTVCTDAFNL